MTLIAAPPNGGKSLLAMYWVNRLAQKGQRILYFSADTDEHDTKIRSAAMLTGHTMEKVESQLLRGGGAEIFYDNELDSLSTIRYDFETDPTYGHLEEVTLGYAEMFGDYPNVIVVDNVTNVVTENDNEFSGMKEVTKALKRMGRQTGASVFALHHMNESEVKDPRYPGSRKAITGKISQYPELVLTLGFDDQAAIMRIAAVKNRSGFKDPSGETFTELHVDASRMALFASRHDKLSGVAI